MDILRFSFDKYVADMTKGVKNDLLISLIKNSHMKKYDMAIITGYGIKLEQGFLVKRIGKTTKKGTRFTFKACESQDEADRYMKKIEKLLIEFNNEYGTSYSLGGK